MQYNKLSPELSGLFMHYHLSELKPIDIQFGGVIQDAYENIAKCDSYPDGFNLFLEKPKTERAYRGRFEDPVQFLAKLRATKEQQLTSEGMEFNQASLPIIYYYRHLNYSLADLGQSGKSSGIHVDLPQDDGKVIKEAWDRITMDVSYRIVFMAYDTRTLDLLVTAFLMYINTPHRLADDGALKDNCPCSNIIKNGFEIDYGFDKMPISFAARSTVNALHVPVDQDQGRILAADIGDFGLSVPVIRSSIGMEPVNPPNVTLIREGLGLTHD